MKANEKIYEISTKVDVSVEYGNIDTKYSIELYLENNKFRT